LSDYFGNKTGGSNALTLTKQS